MKSKIFLTLFMIMGLVIQISAQSLNLNNINKTYLKGSGTIQKNKQIKGYYFFYQIDKIDRTNNLYKLVITDADLNTVAEKEIKGVNTLRIINTAYNNDILAIKFVDKTNPKEIKQIIRFYDNTGNEVSSKSYAFDETSTMRYENHTSVEYSTNDLFELENIGFININYVPSATEKRLHTANYHLIPFDSSYTPWKANTAGWKKEHITYLTSNEKLAFIMSTNYENRKLYLAGVDLHTGKKSFKNELTFGTGTSDFVNISPIRDANENLLFFNLLDSNTNLRKTSSVGVGVKKIDNSGNTLASTEISWKNMLEKFSIKDVDGKKNDFGDVKIHSVIKHENGHYFITGERFFKKTSAKSAITGLLSQGGSAMAELIVAEIVILELDKNLAPVNFKLIDKEYENVSLPAGTIYYGSYILSKLIDRYGGFNFYFIQKFENDEGFTLAYKTFENKESFINTLTYLDGKYIQDKISLKTESSNLWIAPGKPGYILISEYFKKDKKLDIRLEKYKH